MCQPPWLPLRGAPARRPKIHSGVFCDFQAFSGIIPISRDSRLPLHKRTNKISRKHEILILHGTGCIAANGTPQKCALLHFWTNGKPVLRTVQFPEDVPSVEDRIGGSAIFNTERVFSKILPVAHFCRRGLRPCLHGEGRERDSAPISF